MSSYSRCVSCACGPLRWLTGGRHPSGDGACAPPLRRGESLILSPWEPSRVLTASAVSLQQGGFGVASPVSAGPNAPRKHPFPGFGPGSGEARCDDVRTAPSLVTAHRVVPRLRPKLDTPQRHLRQRTCRTAASAKVRRFATISAPSIRPSLSSGACPSRQRRLGTHSFGRVLRNRKRSRAIRAARWLCPANTPDAPIGQGIVD
jgi:hypothetical protein